MRIAPLRRLSGGPTARIVQMGAAFAISDLVRGAIRLVTSLVIARGLGLETFGRWTLYAAWASALTVAFDLGFGVLLTRESARGEEHARPLVSPAVAVRLIAFAPVAAILLFGPSALRFGSSRAVSGAIVVLVGAGLAYGCVGAVFRTTPQRLVTILGLEAAGALVQCIGSVAVVWGGAGVVALLLLSAAVIALNLTVASFIWHLSAPPGERPHFSPLALWKLSGRGLPFAGAGLVANLQARLGPLMLGFFSTPSEVAAFGVATRIEGVARRIPYAAFGAALPVFSSDRGRGTAVRARFDAALKIFALAAGSLLVVGAAPLVRYSYGPDFLRATLPLTLCGAALVPSLLNGSRKVYLNANGGERIVVIWSAIALGVQASLATLLIPRLGASGAVAALAAGDAAAWLPLRKAALSRSSGHDRDKALARFVLSSESTTA